MARPKVLPKLELSCASTDCENGRHYYGASARKNSPYPVGKCRECGAELVDWRRVHKREVADVDHTFASLQTECWRHDWWHKDIDQHAVNYARRKGRVQIEARAHEILRQNIGKEPDAWDGRQTPKEGNIIYYAQHATATCCRKCVEYWHAIPQDRTLSEDELGYLTALVMKYIDLRMPDLAEQGIPVPSIRKGNKAK